MTPGERPIKVFIVEDSPVCRALLEHIYRSDPELQVIGSACNGEEALVALQRLKPDVISMDIMMPKLNGFETTRSIMSTQPVPIVIVTSSFSHNEVAATFQAFEAGALAVVAKPKGPGHPSHAAMSNNLIKTIKAMAEVKLVRRWPQMKPQGPPAMVPVARPITPARRVRMVAIGSSTGGPPALHAILGILPKNFAAPVAIVQHISAGFIEGLRDWLQQATGWPVHIAAHREIPLPGHAYLAPDGSHLGFDQAGRFLLSNLPPVNGLRPAAAFLFRSAAAVFGDTALGVILTGMGSDGAEELKLMKDRGAITFAQDKESSVVHGMPGEAIALGAATHVMPPERIAATLVTLAGEKNYDR